MKHVLTVKEVNFAGKMAARWVEGALAARSVQTWAAPVDKLASTTQRGIMGEMAVSGMLGFRWTGFEGYGAYDVGGYVEVKATEYANGHLLVQRDPLGDDRHQAPKPGPYVCVYVPALWGAVECEAFGWMDLAEIHSDCYRRPNMSFWVPRIRLHSMADLPKEKGVP